MVAIFNFEVPVRLYIKSLPAGITYRVLQLMLIVYIVVFNVYLFKGYQKSELGTGISELKLKGAALVYNKDGKLVNNTKYVMDTVDSIIPPNQHSNLFLTTSFILTNNQTQGICEDLGTGCTTDDDCIEGLASSDKNGIFNGICSENKFCQIYSWCPSEKESKTEKMYFGAPNLTEIANMTLYIKNSVVFNSFRNKVSNIPYDFTKDYIASCIYDKDDPVNKNCPIIRLNDIIATDGRDVLSETGGIIDIILKYDCNFDYSKECLPTYSFKRYDNSQIESSPGLNFRVARYETFNGTEFRHIAKAYGIQLRVVTLATGGKFNLSNLIIVLGSGIAMLTIATTAGEFIVLYCLPSRKLYQKAIKRDMPVEVVKSPNPSTAGLISDTNSVNSYFIEEETRSVTTAIIDGVDINQETAPYQINFPII